MRVPILTPTSTPTDMSRIGNIDIQKYGIRSVSMISEATWTPRILIRHFNGVEYFYAISRTQIEDIKSGDLEDILEKIVREHIRKECIVALRKEKLKKIEILGE